MGCEIFAEVRVGLRYYNSCYAGLFHKAAQRFDSFCMYAHMLKFIFLREIKHFSPNTF